MVKPFPSKTHIGNHVLHPETLMLNYGYDPQLSEGAVKPPVFLTSTFAGVRSHVPTTAVQAAMQQARSEASEVIVSEESSELTRFAANRIHREKLLQKLVARPFFVVTTPGHADRQQKANQPQKDRSEGNLGDHLL